MLCCTAEQIELRHRMAQKIQHLLLAKQGMTRQKKGTKYHLTPPNTARKKYILDRFLGDMTWNSTTSTFNTLSAHCMHADAQTFFCENRTTEEEEALPRGRMTL